MSDSKDIVDMDLASHTTGNIDESRKGLKRKDDLTRVDAEYARVDPVESLEGIDSPPAKKAFTIEAPTSSNSRGALLIGNPFTTPRPNKSRFLDDLGAKDNTSLRGEEDELKPVDKDASLSPKRAAKSVEHENNREIDFVSLPVPEPSHAVSGEADQMKPDIEGSTTIVQEAIKDSHIVSTKLGKGGFGDVFLHKNEKTGKSLACKILRNTFRNSDVSKQAYREVKILSSMDHSNIIRLVKIALSPNQEIEDLHIFMEPMQCDLLIPLTNAPLSLDQVQVLTYQILRGLKYLHSMNIIHRDIKPNNLLVNKDCTLKICDFGVSRVFEPVEDMALNFCHHYYRAPEVVMGIKRYTSAIDVWSVGCVFAEMITGGALFKSAEETVLQTIIAIVGNPPKDDLSHVSETIKSIISEYKKSNPTDPNTREILKNLSPIMTDEAVDLLAQLISYASVRPSAAAALDHPFLEEGRRLYHANLCPCMHSNERCHDPEPTHPSPMDSSFERKLAGTTIADHRKMINDFIIQQHVKKEVEDSDHETE